MNHLVLNDGNAEDRDRVGAHLEQLDIASDASSNDGDGGNNAQESFPVSEPADRWMRNPDVPPAQTPEVDSADLVKALHDAAAKGDLATLKALAKSEAAPLVEVQDEDGDTTLHVAAANGRLAVVEFLVTSCHADIATKNDRGWTSLKSAFMNDQYSMVKMLLDLGADANSISHNECPALACAVAKCGDYVPSEESLEMLQLLLESGGDVEARDAENGETPLHHAARIGCIEAMDILLEHGADPFAVSAHGRTIVHLAALCRHLRVLQWLENRGLTRDFESRCASYQSPLSVAASEGYQDIVEYLVDFQDRRLREKQQHGEQEDRSADLEEQYDYRSEALCLALYEGHFETILFLCQNGASAARSEKNVAPGSWTALDTAVVLGRTDIAEFLIEEQHADLCQVDDSGRMPLHTAAMEGHTAVAKLLLIHGTPVDVRVAYSPVVYATRLHDNSTPLEIAIWYRHYDMVELLLHHGADVDAMHLRDWSVDSFVEGRKKTQESVRIAELLHANGATHFHSLF